MSLHCHLNVLRSIITIFFLYLVTSSVEGTPLPSPQVLPGQVPPHLATHPALSSIQQGRESSLLQYAYNTQNRRGPSPSPLVLQNNQEQNLQLANRYATQRSGRPILPQQPQANLGPGAAQASSSQNPELRALQEIQKFKGQGQNGYEPLPLTPNSGQLNYPHPQGPTGAHSHPGAHSHDHGQENEREDIRRLKELLSLAKAGSSASPNIGVVNPGQRGVLNPAQFPQNGSPPPHGHDHSHNHSPTPFPQTAQSQNSLGTLQFGQGSPRPSIYPGSQGPNPVVHLPYNGAGAHQHAHAHGHDHHHHGQDAQTLIRSVDSPPEAYQNLVYIDPVREPNSINRHIEPSQSVFILPASDYKSDDYQRLINRPAEILIDVIPKEGSTGGADFSLHNFSLLLTPSNYARCAQATHKRGYGGKCKLILRVGKNNNGEYSKPQPVQVSYSK